MAYCFTCLLYFQVTISKHKENQLEGNISSKRPNNVTKGKELLYGRFVKSGATIIGNEMVTNAKQTQSSDDSDDEKDFSNSDTLEKAFKMSGGMTAHKAARHGHQLNGKLKRLQDQEGASYNVKSHAVSHDSSQVICNIDSSDSSENSNHLKPVAKNIVGEIKKMKKKKKDKSLKKTEHVTGELESISDTLDFHSKDCSSVCGKPRKKEKKSNKNSLRECQKIHKEAERGDVCNGKDKTKAQMKDYENCLIDTEKESSTLKEEKRKKKKKRKRTSSQCEDIEKDQVYISQVPESHQDKGPKKKKKKKREIIENC